MCHSEPLPLDSHSCAILQGLVSLADPVLNVAEICCCRRILPECPKLTGCRAGKRQCRAAAQGSNLSRCLTESPKPFALNYDTCTDPNKPCLHNATLFIPRVLGSLAAFAIFETLKLEILNTQVVRLGGKRALPRHKQV